MTATTTVRVTITVSSAPSPAPPHSATPTTVPRRASSSHAVDPTTSAPRPETTERASTPAAETTTRVSVRPSPSPLDDSSSAAATPPAAATSQVVPPDDPVSSAAATTTATGASVSGAPAPISGVPASSGSARPIVSGSVRSFLTFSPSPSPYPPPVGIEIDTDKRAGSQVPLSSGSVFSSFHASGASSTLTVSSPSAVLFTPNPTVTGGTLPSGSTFHDNGAVPRGASAVAVVVAGLVAMGGGMVGWGV